MATRQITAAWMETPNVRTIRIDFRDEPLDFKPGQFLVLSDEFKGYSRPVRRAYSIASSPLQRELVDITVKREIPGLMSAHLTEIPVGYRLDVSGPSGKFYYEPNLGNRILLLGAGSGVTPLHSIARYALEGGVADAEVFLFYSVRTPKDVIFRRQWELLEGKFPNFHYYPTVTRARPGEWPGHHGRITANWIRQSAGDVTDCVTYICGPGPMVAASEAVCKELSIPGELVHTEKW